jgi:hypothetical protein
MVWEGGSDVVTADVRRFHGSTFSGGRHKEREVKGLPKDIDVKSGWAGPGGVALGGLRQLCVLFVNH